MINELNFGYSIWKLVWKFEWANDGTEKNKQKWQGESVKTTKSETNLVVVVVVLKEAFDQK